MKEKDPLKKVQQIIDSSQPMQEEARENEETFYISIEFDPVTGEPRHSVYGKTPTVDDSGKKWGL